ncbi:MAG: hypothetical protein ACOC1I_03330 [Spirochaetota bacterium]
MRVRIAVFTLLLVALVSGLAAADEPLRRINLGLILDTPFLHQDELPYESTYTGPYGDELTRYRYDEQGRPAFIRYIDEQAGLPYLDIEPYYSDDGRLERLVYTSYEEESDSVAFVDDFSFSDYGPTGPQLGVMTSDEGISVRIRLTYDEAGRLVELEEDNAFGDGLFRRERYAWVEGLHDSAPEALPYAIEIDYPQDAERDRFFLLYDARLRLLGTEGINALETDPDDVARIESVYRYSSDTLDDVFGVIVPAPRQGDTATARAGE